MVFCISEEFWKNDFGDADCLDRSDEFANVLYPNNCYRDPTFRCEEHLCRTNWFDFSCGDGQCIQTFDKCHNRHHLLLIQLISNQGYLSNNCLIAMMCFTQVIEEIHEILSETLFLNNLINDFIKNCDSIFQFPINPIYMNHIHLLYGWVWSDEINHIQADTAHKKLFKWFFGQDLPPEFIAGGFAYQNGQWKYNALVFNTKQDIYHNNKKEMPLTEKQLLGGALSRLYINHRWQQDPNISVREIFSSNEGWQLFESVNTVVNPNRVDKVNKYGRVATIGVTGKYYCGDYLDVIRCCCCDGRCGPGNGCNCSGCMELDIENRRLPKGALVNRDGAPASRSRIDGKTFYCGRPVLTRTNYCDGYCGPNNGPQCYACQALNEQTPRYKTLLNEYDYT
ncbi:unnamed protein product [Rotaria sp. Silwood2]|nr:unnamed protein product [Rotaria sp. Silwood2]CAF4243689.1 unnamed protein product [Rotaria sp. Silwood2]